MLNFDIYTKDVEIRNDKWVVFVHGIGGSTLTWKKQIKPFVDKYNLLLIDLPGHGKSQDGHIQKLKKSEVNKEIKEVLDYLHIEKADFICLSLGTLVVANFAIKYPEYINSIIFGGAVIQLHGFYNFLMKTANKIKNVLPKQLMFNTFASIMLPKTNHKKSRNIFIREGKKMQKEYFMDWINYLTMACHPQKLLNNLKAFNFKMLFISGDEDSCFIKGVKDACQTLDKKLNLIKHCGHVCTIEKAKEFNDMAIRFLDNVHKTNPIAVAQL